MSRPVIQLEFSPVAEKHAPPPAIAVVWAACAEGREGAVAGAITDGLATNAVLAATVASIGNLLQGWDNAAIAGFK
ncbi:hypothetical protein E2562_005449 [Oryza meyeriana var. granulata]|uniref:Uncharacterized protein n=1 Tax=Oryza meyeriana var. granulata TaxID=110450 RepID=A0A6G1DH52_9ORYZ|nr:hypothetical protein E2562_005449 [Oryza meyeriana var. granulata]